jgi:hypothetical protein
MVMLIQPVIWVDLVLYDVLSARGSIYTRPSSYRVSHWCGATKSLAFRGTLAQHFPPGISCLQLPNPKPISVGCHYDSSLKGNT